MKKKIFKSVLAVITAISMMSSITVMAKEKNNTASQEDFLDDLKTGLEKRWEISDNSGDTESMSSDEVIDFDTNVVNAEYDLLEKYKDCTFDNKKFSMMAAAYIDALETQQKAIGYYKDSNSIYNQFWSAGYNVRAILVPDFVDYYGMDIEDQTNLKEFRDTKTALESGTATYTITSTDTTDGTTSADTSDVNLGENQQPIEVYNDDGIKITITGYGKSQYNSQRLVMSVVNLYHKDISISSANNSIVVNGTSINSSLYGEIQSGKTGEAILDIYQDQLGSIDIDDISTIDFKLAIYKKDSYQLKAETNEIYLTVNNGIVSQRVVYTDKENIQKVQQLLTQLGYNSGSTDGVPGKLTNSAILQFEKDYGYAENTDITPDLIAQLEQAVQQQN
ncbi:MULTISPECIES: peptidoglycan-binding domain-containing protein [Clostridia]|uniref:peptidoglycan-binding domain-containing protein n=1 Tax=Clostridia TaxID=186801 RepID=UPI0015F7F41E|nr:MULTISPECIES: peptidoglycan-binding domain-containing protein [Clostridia]